jgi:hypothetical protein
MAIPLCTLALACSSGDGPGGAVGEQAGAAAAREMTDDNPVAEAVGGAIGDAAGDQADKAGSKEGPRSSDKDRKD